MEKGLVSRQELAHALAEQESTGRMLGAILVERRYVSGPALAIALAEQCGVELNTERGFGTGLWAAIDRRHRAGRGTNGDAENVVQLEHAKPQLEAVPDPEPELEALRAENQRLQAEIERLRQEFTTLHVVQTPEPATAHLLFVPTSKRYELVERLGPPPEPGDDLELPEGLFVVTKVGRSPFPAERRPCAFLVRR